MRKYVVEVYIYGGDIVNASLPSALTQAKQVQTMIMEAYFICGYKRIHTEKVPWSRPEYTLWKDDDTPLVDITIRRVE
jgi:hypothetical protein